MDIHDSQRIKEIRDNTAKMADAFTRIADALERLTDRKTENSSEKPNNCEEQYEMGMGTLKCDNCSEYGSFKCAKCDGEMYFKRLEPKDEPQTNADQHIQHVGSVESVEPTWTREKHEAFYTFLWNVINPNEMQDYIGMFETEDEPQTERSE